MDKKVQFDFIEDKEPYTYKQLYRYEAAVRSTMVEVFQNQAEISLYAWTALAFSILKSSIEHYRSGETGFEKLKRDIAWHFQDKNKSFDLIMIDSPCRYNRNPDYSRVDILISFLIA